MTKRWNNKVECFFLSTILGFRYIKKNAPRTEDQNVEKNGELVNNLHLKIIRKLASKKLIK